MGGQSRQVPIQVLVDQLTLYQPDGVDCAHPALGSVLRPCSTYTTTSRTLAQIVFIFVDLTGLHMSTIRDIFIHCNILSMG